MKRNLWAASAEAKGEYDPEKRLWAAAFEETIRTALGQVRSEKASARQQSKRIQEQALKEIMTEGGDFDEICHVLSVNPDFVRRKVKELIAWKSSMRRKLRVV